MGRSGIHGGTGKEWIEDHLEWSVQRWSGIHPSRGASGNHAAISMTSLRCISSGFGFHLNRRDFAVRYRDAGWRR
jgi:hypothetical protein